MSHPPFRHRKTLLAMLVPALVHGIALAEEMPLGGIAVTAPEIADSLFSTPLAEDDLKRARASTSDTAKLLENVPGVSTYGAGGVSSLPAIHGLADDRLRIKVDGMDLVASCPNHMNPPLSYVDPSNVEAINVYAGITPVSVGGDSIGGSIIVDTFVPTFAAPGKGSITQGEVGAFYRSNGNAVGMNLNASHATESFQIAYSGALAKADNYKAGGDFKDYAFTGRAGHTLPYDEVGSTAYETRNHKLNLAFRKDAHLFEAGLNIQDLPFQLYPNQRMDMLDNEQQAINLRYLGQLDWGALEARVYHENVEHFMDFGDDKRYWYGADSGGGSATSGTPCAPISATCAAGMPMYTESKTTGASVKADIALSGQNLLRVGAEMHHYRLDDWWPASGSGMWPGTFWNINDGKRDRTALFAEWEAQRGTNWITLLGARYENVQMDAGDVRGYNPSTDGMGAMKHYQQRDGDAFNALDRSRTDNNLDFTALARYTPRADLNVEFGFARKVRSPGLYEVYPWSTWQMAALMNNFVGDGNGYVGNPDLKPETAHTVSATFDWHAPEREWEFKATPYYTRVTDYIDAVQWNAMANMPAATLAQNKFTVLRYVNQTARLYGVDLSGKVPLAKTGWGKFGLKGLINYTNGRNTDTDDGLYNVMPLNARLALTHKLGGWDNAVEVVMVADKDDVSDVRNEIETGGYTLVNLRASHAWKQVRVDFGVENLTDKLYYLPTGGAYVGQGTTMTNPALPNYPQWGTAVPGPGRSFYTNLTFKF